MSISDTDVRDQWVLSALDEARTGIGAGGMPFGAVIVVDGEIVSRGHNRQIQDSNFLAHAETVCLSAYLNGRDHWIREAILVATEAPCPMCAGAASIVGIKEIVVGEIHHYRGACDWLISQGVKVTVLNNQNCIDLVANFRDQNPDLWSRFSAG